MLGFSRTTRQRSTAANYGFGSHPYAGSVESPPATLDPQTRFGADFQYAYAVRRPEGQGGFPYTKYPWITFGGPQLEQAPSLHNIYNAVPPYFVKYATNPQINQSLSNRIRSVTSTFTLRLPTGIGSALGGVS